MELPESIRAVCEGIRMRFAPESIRLFQLKRSIAGDAASFKLCVVLETDDPAAAERSIYLAVESEIPFDVLVYTPLQWRELLAKSGSFAATIAKKGTVVYAKAS